MFLQHEIGDRVELFVSWSGEKSRAIAEVLRAWIPCVLQGVHPFVSSQDIEAGSRWGVDVASRLDSADFGLVVITRENMSAAWINFEAGALSRTVGESTAKVAVLLTDIDREDLKGPLTSFQNTRFEEDDVRQLVESMNVVTSPQLSDVQLQTVFDKWWPDLEAEVVRVNSDFPSHPGRGPVRNQEDILAEVLALLRNESRVGSLVVEDDRSADEPDALSERRDEILAKAQRNRYRNQIRRILAREGIREEPKFLRSAAGDLIVRLPESAPRALAGEIRALADPEAVIRLRVSSKPA